MKLFTPPSIFLIALFIFSGMHAQEVDFCASQNDIADGLYKIEREHNGGEVDEHIILKGNE